MAHTVTQSVASGDRVLAWLIDELMKLLAEGRSDELPDFFAEHAEHAEQLQQLMPALEALVQIRDATESVSPRRAGNVSSPIIATSDTPGDPDKRILGDFQIIREIGRGGMGVVYEAEQLSLSRRVALKVLPFAAMLDERQLQRFKNEARAAATLHHPNIVPVFSVGCERSVHFYAMQFIEGQSLAEVIEGLKCGTRNAECGVTESKPSADSAGTPNSGLRTPNSSDTVAAALSTIRTTKPHDYFRRIAELGIQAAEALDYAHSLGIIHRDIKPANLLLECSHLAPRDGANVSPHGRGHGEGAGLTTDHRPLTTPRLWITDFGLARVQSDPGMTMTGDLLGTLRYMSPEQALAKRVVVDHRTDIYSLGVTLYELLTHRPAFNGADRQELLRQIAFEEPTPPRKLNPSIPAELEHILLKTYEKESIDRYASARELAEDLQRFLENKPVRARRISLARRAQKWVRRHPTAVLATTSAVGVLFVAALVTSLATIQANEQVSQERERAVARLDVATGLLTLFGEQLASDLKDIPRASTLQRKILEETVKFYEQFPEDDRRKPRIQFAHARAMRSLSGVYAPINDSKLRYRSLDLLRQAISIQENLTEIDSKNQPESLRELGFLYSEYAGRLSLGGPDYPESLLDLKTKSLNIFRRLLAADPESQPARLDLIDALLTLAAHYGVDCFGTLPHEKDLAKGETLCREALTLVESLDDSGPEMHRAKNLAKVNVALATKLDHMERTTDAEVALRRAIAAYEDLLKSASADTDLRERAASANSLLAKLLRSQGRLAEEEPFFTRSAQLQQELVKDFPERTQYRHFLVWLYGTRGQYFVMNRMWSQACDMLQQRLPHQLQIFRILPVDHNLRHYRNSYYSYANILYELGRLEDARDAFRETLRIARTLVKEKVAVVDSAEWLAFIHSTCPFPDLCDYEASIDVMESAVPPGYLDPDTDAAPFSDEHIVLGMSFYRGGELQKALATLRGESTPAAVDYHFYRDADRILWRCRILLDLGETDQARKEFGKAKIDAESLPPRDDDGMAFLARKRLMQECSEILQLHQPPEGEAEAGHVESIE